MVLTVVNSERAELLFISRCLKLFTRQMIDECTKIGEKENEFGMFLSAYTIADVQLTHTHTQDVYNINEYIRARARAEYSNSKKNKDNNNRQDTDTLTEHAGLPVFLYYRRKV